MSHTNVFAGVAFLGLMVAVQRSSPAQESNASSIPADGRVIGTVVDEKAGTPIRGALVMLSDGRITETDVAGRFLFLHVRPGSHEIAAVAHGCAQAAGGFSLASGRDALLRLEVVAPAPVERLERSTGWASRVITPEQLAAMRGRSALEAVLQYHANTFIVNGSRLALRTRAVSAFEQVVEPLLVLDGMRMEGRIANALEDLRAVDVERIDIHLGSAAGWQFQPGGAAAVIEVRTRKGLANTADAFQSPDRCLNWKGR